VTLRFGVLSTARIGREKVIPGIKTAAGCEVVAIASRETGRAGEVAAEHGIPTAHDGYAALLADPNVDAVYIPLPNHLHAEWTMAAAAAGKHVLCEKPLAMNAAQAREMADACATSGVMLMEAFMYRLHPSWLRVRQLVDAGVIGELQSVQSWFSYYNDDPANIRNIAEYGGGALMDIGCYNINLSRMLFGGEPTSVQATIRRDPTSGVDILTSAMLRFGDGHATFTCAIRTEDDQRVHIVGTAGRIEIAIPFNIPPHLPTRVFLTSGGDPPLAPDTETIVFPPKDPYAAQAEAFAAAVVGGHPVPVPPEDSVANMAVIDAIVAAAG